MGITDVYTLEQERFSENGCNWGHSLKYSKYLKIFKATVGTGLTGQKGLRKQLKQRNQCILSLWFFSWVYYQQMHNIHTQYQTGNIQFMTAKL